MYSNETMKKAVANLQKSIDDYRENVKTIHVHISTGNRKIGNTLNVSIAPVITCPNCSGCCRYCYDIKAVMQYPEVLRARSENTAILFSDPDRYFPEIETAIQRRKKNKYFRWHVSGDIPNKAYFLEMVRIANKYPEFRFWTYTKNYKAVNEAIEEGTAIPENLSVMFSRWEGMAMDNPHGMPEFRVVLKGQEKPEGVKWCCGNCNVCINACSHCVKGETVYCMEH